MSFGCFINAKKGKKMKGGVFLERVLQVGETPLIEYEYEGRKIYIKLEGYNPSGSMKDRAAMHILSEAKRRELINDETVIIESSSGNFGIALAMACKKMNLKFICVIDNNTNLMIEKLLKVYDAEVIKVDRVDEHGGYLGNRIKKVKEIINNNANIYWINQYENILNAEAYYSLADEIKRDMKFIDYVFLPVSSGGTITGVSRRLKEWNPKVKIIAVDSSGSVIFGGQAKKRFIPGMGSSIVPPILKMAYIDDIIYIEESSMIYECKMFLEKNCVLIGGSSGACLCAIKQYCGMNGLDINKKIVTIFPDKGERYVETIYNDSWCNLHYNM